jgi:pimeloyl-ACP methyl ester carboxylesterase
MKDNDGFFTRGNVTATQVRTSWSESRRSGPVRPLAAAAKGTRRFVRTTSGLAQGIECHRGFWKVWQRICQGCMEQYGVDPIEKIFQSLPRASGPTPRQIIFVGHSMGACLASIAMYQFLHRYPHLQPRMVLINFGAPLFARKGFNTWLEEHLPHRILNLCMIGDKTVSLPGLPFTGWYSPGARLWLSPAGIEATELYAHFQYWSVLRYLCLKH